MLQLEERKKVVRLTPNDIRPNSGTPAAPAPLQWVVQQSAFPWVNSVTLWPIAERESR
ncbi:MAG: hypothetical protein JWM80_3269 [Cyanobacteria bacterium RYN_339]|nr:hypothetical protein [Cyanobacteria bacterium RYN_339]